MRSIRSNPLGLTYLQPIFMEVTSRNAIKMKPDSYRVRLHSPIASADNHLNADSVNSFPIVPISITNR